MRDWTDLGGSPADIQPLSKWKSDQRITMGDGILFVTYATLRSAGKCGTTRLNQLLDWVGDDFDGVLAFDEAHAMQNAAGSEQGRGANRPSRVLQVCVCNSPPHVRAFSTSLQQGPHLYTISPMHPGLGFGAKGPNIPSRAARASSPRWRRAA